MYEQAQEQLTRIVALADGCPEAYRVRAFEILLQGYVDSLRPLVPVAPAGVGGIPAGAGIAGAVGGGAADGRGDHDWLAGIPGEVLPRLRAMAKRRSIDAEKLAAVFDFSSDPFTFAPLHVEGRGVNDRSRRAALLVAARSFLASGRWVADWAEIKAMCAHQNCYDGSNFAKTMRAAKGEIFKSVTPGANVEISATGQEQAEQLLTTLAGGGDAAAQ